MLNIVLTVFSYVGIASLTVVVLGTALFLWCAYRDDFGGMND